MLRIVECKAAEAAKRYYTGGLSRGDYYEEVEAGLWGGFGAERMGLVGEVEREAFVRLCENRRPDGLGALTERTKAYRRVGYDLNFHCPKSVSVLHALLGDPRILQAFREAVDETMRGIESEMKTRVRVGGESSDRETRNLVWATFIHTTTRPVDGIPDPHLHAHCFAFNATWDPVEKRWKAGQFGDLKRDARYFEAYFHALLTAKLNEAGYAIERRGKGWEIAGVPLHLIKEFSRRTAEIEAAAKKRGITDPVEKSELGAKTRRSKDESLPAATVRARWEQQLKPGDRDELKKLNAKRAMSSLISPEASVDYALSHCFERASVVREKLVMETAMRRGVGCVTPVTVRHALDSRALLSREVSGQTLVTTPEVLHEEEAMISVARNGRNTCRSFSTERPTLSDTKLNAGQRAAVEYLLSSTDRVMVVRGKAGTGKTTLMQEAVSRIEVSSGRSVQVLAPTSEASRGVLRSEGFPSADTVARFLTDQAFQARIKGGVLWVDEAGLLGCKSMNQLFTVAAKQNARVILSGDVSQHAAVERGDALRILERDAGLGAVTLREVLRQRGEYKAAVEDLSKGHVMDGFRRLDRLGAIREVPQEVAHQEIAHAYAECRLQRKSVLIVSPTHAEGRAVTAVVRERLTTQGLLGDPRDFERLRSLGVTAAERRDPHTYEPGHVVEFHQNAKGFRAGGRHEVLGKDSDGHVLVQHLGKSVPLPLEQAERFDVFEKERLQVAAGDVIRITRNGRIPAEKGETATGNRQLANGSLHSIRGFTRDGNLTLTNGWVVPKDFGHLTHGYCVTSHASQGKTVDVVLVAQSSGSFVASSAEQFYVSASRAREKVFVFTDNKAELLEAVRVSSPRMGAVELLHQGPDAPARSPSHPAVRKLSGTPHAHWVEPKHQQEPDRGR